MPQLYLTPQLFPDYAPLRSSETTQPSGIEFFGTPFRLAPPSELARTL